MSTYQRGARKTCETAFVLATQTLKQARWERASPNVTGALQKERKRSWPVSRVLSWTAIPLGPGSLQASSHLPASSAGRVIARLFGVAPGGGCRVSPLPRPARPGVSADLVPHQDSSLWPCSSPSTCAGLASRRARCRTLLDTRLCCLAATKSAHASAGGCYPLPYPVEPGLSSARGPARKTPVCSVHSGCLASFTLSFYRRRRRGSRRCVRGLEYRNGPASCPAEGGFHADAA